MKNDNKLAELIIRNLADIEHAIQFIEEYVNPRLSENIFKIFDGGVGATQLYFNDRSDPGGWFCPEDWLLTESKKKDANVWFQIDTPDDDPWFSWAAQFCGGAPIANTSALLVRYNAARIGKRRWLEIRGGMPEQIDIISKAGFLIDGDQIYYPLQIDHNELADALGRGEITDALGVIIDAAAALDKAMPAFERLFEAQEKLMN